MTLPGVSVTSQDTPPSRSAPTDTGVWFVSGLTEKGVAGTPRLVKSLSEFVTHFGGRVAYGYLYDALDVFFREGGNKAYVTRVLGPDPASSTIEILDQSGSSSPGDVALVATATSEGDWADGIQVVVDQDGSGTDPFTITILDADDNTLEVSPSLADGDEAVAWALTSSYIRLEIGASAENPRDGSYTLAGGDDDRTNVTDTEWDAALDLFTADYGPGQVSFPGRYASSGHESLVAHAALRNRIPLLDLEDTDDAGDLLSAAADVRALAGARYVGMFSPWAVVPGVAGGTERTVPYSAVQAGMIARMDAATGNPNEPAAGNNGVSRYATGLSQSAFSDADRESLNNAGVNVARVVYGAVRTYGYRTAVNPVTDATWLLLNNARLNMLVVAKVQVVMERFLFRQLDGRRYTIAEFGGAVTGELLPLWQIGALFGDTPAEAFSVDVGEGVNTDETMAAGELNCHVGLKMSPFAEKAITAISKSAITEEL